MTISLVFEIDGSIDPLAEPSVPIARYVDCFETPVDAEYFCDCMRHLNENNRYFVRIVQVLKRVPPLLVDYELSHRQNRGGDLTLDKG